jgi:uncharacterized protein (UPF0332 family)
MINFDWLLYLELSDFLISSGYSKQIPSGSENFYRSAISRAYYGAFDKIRTELEYKGFKFSQANVHSQVIEWLISQSNLGIKAIGRELDFLRRERNRADYVAGDTFGKYRAEKSLIIARSIVENAQKLKIF